ncbi:MAG: response regulator transcription factor [Anaerolineales bacterium]|nr:response regulator transcription factor [Anaerolineales bacterium]
MTPVAGNIKVVILSDAALQRLAWEALLSPQPGLELFGTVANLEGLLVCASSAGQTAVLLDLREPLLEQVTQIAKSLPNVGLLCLVDVYDLDQIVALLQAGAAGVLSRDATLSELSRSLIAASRGEIVLPPELAARTLAALARGKLTRQQNIDSLTERERDVLTRLAQGMTNKEIAQTLFLSVRTVEAHLHNIYGKLNVASRTEAVLWAVQHGLEP